MQQEQLRHQYLDALGISSWLPRTPLPAAQPSPDWVYDFQYPAPEIPFDAGMASTDAVANARQTISRPTPKAPVSAQAQKQGVNQARAALGLGELTTAVPPDSKITVSDTATVKTTSPPDAISDTLSSAASDAPPNIAPADASNSEVAPPRFKLAFQRIGPILVVDSLPLQGNQFGAHYQALATAIVRSLNVDTASQEPFLLPWPMFASKTLDQGRQQAVITVQHKLQKELANTEVQAVLLFGEAAAQMVLDRQESLDTLAGVLFSVANGAKALATSSLTEAMQLPGIKPQMWQQLQPLLTHLNAQSI